MNTDFNDRRPGLDAFAAKVRNALREVTGKDHPDDEVLATAKSLYSDARIPCGCLAADAGKHDRANPHFGGTNTDLLVETIRELHTLAS